MKQLQQVVGWIRTRCVSIWTCRMRPLSSSPAHWNQDADILHDTGRLHLLDHLGHIYSGLRFVFAFCLLSNQLHRVVTLLEIPHHLIRLHCSTASNQRHIQIIVSMFNMTSLKNGYWNNVFNGNQWEPGRLVPPVVLGAPSTLQVWTLGPHLTVWSVHMTFQMFPMLLKMQKHVP